jgi:hypothetical protein
MSVYDLLAAWFRVADWAAYDLAKQGAEGIVLKPLGRHSKAATFIARFGFTSSNYRHRKVAASLAGWVQQSPPDLLAQLFQQELERDRRMPKDDLRRLDTQSVVEDIVFSAALWARHEHSRPPALQLLRDVVERTLAGEYWNTASYAMTTLCRHQATGCDELLTRFRKFASSAIVNHPSRPCLTQEKEFAENLAARNPKTLHAIESSLNQKEEVASANLDENSRAAIEELLQAAERFEAAAAQADSSRLT